MVAEIVALLMFVGPDIKEHRIQPEGMAQFAIRGSRKDNTKKVFNTNVLNLKQN